MSAKLFLPAALAATLLLAQRQPLRRPPSSVQRIEGYIQHTWDVLTRSDRDLDKAAPDPKFPVPRNGRWPVYIPRQENLDAIARTLRADMSPAGFAKIELLPLPEDWTQVRNHGLLYLPRPYVVPGGRFNEMYGWDSYFIQAGLLRDGKIDLAKDMADNFLYEIRNYGKILNANRTYFLGRSQPPFLTEMLLGVYQKTHDKDWLAAAAPAIEKYYAYWNSEPHLTPDTGLSRYFDSGEGPAPEALSAERDAQGRTHYDLVREYYKTHQVTDYDVSQYYDRAADRLTPLFYKGDRSMRESGFDPSNRFGPFNADIVHYDPVCLNSLLYRMEQETGEIQDILGDKAKANLWRGRAEARAAKIRRLLWDSKDGLFYDYDFVHRRIRRYPYLTTFYPLWAGIATREQAARVDANVKLFEARGGLQTSTTRSGSQWDAPFVWAPIQWIAVDGLRRYGYAKDADRVSEEFLSTVMREFLATGTIVEKYDAVRGAADLGQSVRFGYHSNEVGFGWTNAAFNALYDELQPAPKSALDRISPQAQ